MPLDIMQQLDDEKRALASSGDNSELLGALSEIQEKAGKSSEALSVLDSIIKSMTASGKNLHSCIGDVVKDFEAYDRIASKSRKETSALSAEYATLGAAGVNGINRINDSLIQSISLLQTVEREVKKYENALASVKAPSAVTPKVSSTPIKQYASGGQIQGRHKTGDRNLVRVNAGEWIFNERQMDNLKKQLGAHSHADVFRRAGGNPNRVNRDSYGTPMAFGGIRGRAINSQISQQRNNLESWYNAPRTYSTTKPNIEAADQALERLNNVLDKISRQDFDRLNIDGRIEAIFTRMNSGTVNTSRALQSLTRQIDAVVNIVEVDAEATRQLQLAADTLVNVDLSRFSGDALTFAENLERSKKILESEHSTAEEKATARMEVNSNKAMLDLFQQRYLTRGQRAQRQDLISRYNAAGNAQDRANVAQEATSLGNMDNLERRIDLRDAVGIGVERKRDEEIASIKAFLGGTPVGLTAVGVAAGYAAKEVVKFIDGMTSGLETATKLSVENARLGKSFDSMFGSGAYENFRDELGLTKKEMVELAPVITDAYRNAGVEMEHIQEVASNIVKEFGEMDPKMLQEALGVMKELTSDQVKILMTGNGSSKDKANMYANLSESGNSGRAADLLEQGILGGENLSANISDADREIIENLHAMRKAEENLSLWAKDAFGMIPFLSNTIPLAKYGQAIISFGATALQLWTSVKVIEALMESGAASNAASNAANGASSFGRLLSKASPYLIGISAGISVAGGVASGFSAEAAKSRERSKKKNEDKITSAKSFYDQTSIYSSDTESLIDYDKVKETANSYATTGAWIGGVTGAIAGAIGGGIAGSAIATPGAGTLIGAVGGGAAVGYLGAEAGGKIGYDIGYDKEMKRQKENWEGVFGEDFDKIWKTFEKTQRELQEIRKVVEEERKTQIKSLRFQESIEKVAKKIQSGQYTRFNDRMVATSKQAIDVMSISGGNSSQYSAQVSNILSNAAESYSTTLKVIGEQQKRVATQTGIDEEARLNKSRQLMELEAETTKKFVEAVYESIGNYEQIPEVIKNSLQEKINSITIEMNRKNMAGTSNMTAGLLRGNLFTALNSQDAAFSQFEKERPQLEEAQKKAKELFQQKVSEFQSNSTNFDSLGLSKDIVDGNGNIRGDVLRDNYARISEQRKNLDAEILRGEGWSAEHSRRASDALSLMDSPIKNVSELRSKINSTSEDDFDDGKGKSLQKDTLRTLQEMLAAAEERFNDLKGTQLENAANEDFIAINSILERFKKENEGEMSKDQLLKFLRGLESANNTGNQMQKIRNSGRSMPGVSEKLQGLATAENTLNQVSAANDGNIAAMRNLEKQYSNLMAISKKVSDAAMAVAGQIDLDPTVTLFQRQKEYFDAYSEYLLGSNQSTEYISSTIGNMAAKLRSEQMAIEKASGDLDEAQIQNKANIAKRISEEKGSENYRQVLRMLSDFQDLKVAAVSDPSKNGAVFEAQAVIDNLMKGVSKEEQTKLNAILAQIAGISSGISEIGVRQAKADSQSFQDFKKILGLMDIYKGELKYLAINARSERISVESGWASANLDTRAISALSEEMRNVNAARLQEDLKATEDWKKEALASLNPNDPDYRQKAGIIEDQARQRNAENILNYQKKQVEAAKQEYELKAKIVDMTNRQIDIQLDLAQTIGAPMETIVALERQRVQQARETAAIAEEQYDNLIKSGATQEEIEEAKLKMQEAQSKVIKDSLGAQRSAMEKLFGNMIGSFGEVAGIAGPNNIAGKYGLGYIQGPDGSVRKSDGKPSGGYRDRVFGNFAAGGVALRDGSIPGGSSTTINAQGNSPATAPNVEVAKAASGATAKSKSMDGFSTLGEKFKDTKEGIEIAVFWEKKIYNLLEESFRTMTIGKPMSGWVQNPGIPGRPGVTAPFIDATALPAKGKKEPRSTVWVDPNVPKRNGAGGISVIGEEKPKAETPTSSAKPAAEEKTQTPAATAELPKEAQALLNAMSPMAMIGKNPFQDLVAQAAAPKNIFTMTPEERVAWQKQQSGANAAKPGETAATTAPSPIQAAKPAATQSEGGFWSGMWNGTKNIAGDLWSGAKAVHTTVVNGLANMLQPAVDEQEGITPEMRAAANAASNPTKHGTTTSNGSQNINVEVQVKFNNQMFENQITKVVTSPSVAKNVVSTGMGKA